MANRDFFSNQIKKTLLGPGSDVFALPENEEVISDYPLQRYYTGILFPEKTINSPDEQDGREDAGAEKEDDDIELVRDDNHEAAESKNTSSSNKDEETIIAANQYFPTNIGITVCLQHQTKKIEVIVSGAYYKLAKPSETKIAFSLVEKDELYQKLSNDTKSRLLFENEMLFFIREPQGNTRGGRTEDYAIPQLLRNSGEISLNIIEKFERLLTPDNRLWKRVPFSEKINIDTTVKNYRTTVITEGGKLDLLTKKIDDKKTGNKYLKCLLFNASPEHPQNRFTNSDNNLNRNSFFQIKLSISSPEILPYKKPSFSINQFDPEANLVNYQYRSIKEYAIGHGCGIYSQNENNITTVCTTFLPEIDLPLVSNKLEENPFFDNVSENIRISLNNVLEIKQLSIWSEHDNGTIFQELRDFVSMYKNWIDLQIQEANKEPEYQDYSSQLIAKQENTLKRLSDSIDLLENNKDAFECFRYANAAMYIQLITSTDNRFAKKHKELREITDKENVYDNLDFFKVYNQSEFAYRPFQLAFLLLNLKSIINPTCSDERNLVDLLWFPTGGGKTEA